MATGRPLTENVPDPIIFGPDFPSFKMLMRRGRQTFESRTNRNLFLNRVSNSDQRGTRQHGRRRETAG